MTDKTNAERARRHRAKKKAEVEALRNGQAANGALEVVVDGKQISAPLVEALDAMLVGALDVDALHGTPYAAVSPAGDLEAVVQTLSNGTEVLLVQTGTRQLREWAAIGRFEERRVGSHHYVSARPFRGPIVAAVFGACEVACGRDWQYAPPPKTSSFTSVHVPAAYVTGYPSYSHTLWCKHRTIWLPVGRKTVAPRSGSHEPPPPPPGGKAYPNIPRI